MTKPKEDEPIGLALLRKPFPPNQISKLPKATKAQTDAVKADFKVGIRCKACGQWHHKDVVHLDYVGHAALTDRLLDCDPCWNWEPVAILPNGTPEFDRVGGMWIRLTVCGITRLGYGHPDGKTGGDAIKEVIGDALRNAAMRFGAALDLWHKGDLHVDDAPEEPAPSLPQDQERTKKPRPSTGPLPPKDSAHDEMVKSAIATLTAIGDCGSLAELREQFTAYIPIVRADPRVIDAKDRAKDKLQTPPPRTYDLGGDDIPY
jgi:hypothetical protein